jgi:hypothetical protein
MHDTNDERPRRAFGSHPFEQVGRDVRVACQAVTSPAAAIAHGD